MLVAAFSVNHVCPVKYRTRHEIEQTSDLHLASVSVKFTPNQGTGEGEGMVGLQPYHFFCLQRRLYFRVPADMDNAWILPVESNKTEEQ